MYEKRYYMGKVECEILNRGLKKYIVRWRESGIIGNETEGRKEVHPGEIDIVPIRLLWGHKKE